MITRDTNYVIEWVWSEPRPHSDFPYWDVALKRGLLSHFILVPEHTVGPFPDTYKWNVYAKATNNGLQEAFHHIQSTVDSARDATP